MVPAVEPIRQSPGLASVCCACDPAPCVSDLPTSTRSSSSCASAPASHPPTNCCRSDRECCFPPPIELHNAYAVETVTIYYRWHPLFGLTLPVRMRRKDRAGQCIYCESEGRIYPVPSWMLSPECAQLLLGPPLVSAEALAELHDLLTRLPIHADCDKASQNSPPKEGVDETIGNITLPANESSTPQRTRNRNWRRAAQRIDHRADGTTHQRSARRKRVRRKRASRKRRRG